MEPVCYFHSLCFTRLLQRVFIFLLHKRTKLVDDVHCLPKVFWQRHLYGAKLLSICTGYLGVSRAGQPACKIGTIFIGSLTLTELILKNFIQIDLCGKISNKNLHFWQHIIKVGVFVWKFIMKVYLNFTKLAQPST